MAVLDTRSPRRRPDVARLTSGRPEIVAGAFVLVAWGALLLLAAQGTRSGSEGGTDMPGMPGMTAVASNAAAPVWSRAVEGLPQWVLMTVAMMGPVAVAGVRHTALNSLRWRRGRGMAEFAAGYLAAWTAFGGLALVAAELASPVPGSVRLGIVLAAASAWELSSLKRRCMLACHRTVPLPLYGWHAERGALLFGLRQGLSCLGTCWCLMLIMVAAPGGHLLWTVALTAVISSERFAEHPRRAARFVGAGLVAAAVATIVVALG
jgi:predicted metal-binding membrane protein